MSTPLPVPSISNIPFGLLGLLGLKNGGRNPRLLQDMLSPTLDMWERYLWAASESYQGQLITHAASIGAVNFTLSPTTPIDLPNGTNVQVPEGETWILLQAVMNWSLRNAGQIFDAGFEVVEAVTSYRIHGELQGFVTAPVGTTSALPAVGSRVFQGMLALPPGSVLRGIAYQSLGGAIAPNQITAEGRFRFTRLPM